MFLLCFLFMMLVNLLVYVSIFDRLKGLIEFYIIYVKKLVLYKNVIFLFFNVLKF